MKGLKSGRQSATAASPPPTGLGISRRVLLAGLAAGGFGTAFGLTRIIQHQSAPPGMVGIPGGEFTMGTDSELGWTDEKPAHQVKVDGFFMDEHEVTNAQFRAFVESTGYTTTAEKPLDVVAILRQSPPGHRRRARGLATRLAGFHADKRPDSGSRSRGVPAMVEVDARACWKHPEGPGSTIDGKDDHPVVHVSWDDAVASCRWAGQLGQ